MPNFVSWADTDRDLTVWRGNNLQEDALQAVYALRVEVYALKDSELLEVWRSLLTSDHFYYMCTKYAADGDVHKYFNPYHNPYEAYINYQNIISDLALELSRRKNEIAVATKSKPHRHRAHQRNLLRELWRLIRRKLKIKRGYDSLRAIRMLVSP